MNSSLCRRGSESSCTAKARCTVCGLETGEKTAHTDADSNGKCDACSAVLGTTAPGEDGPQTPDENDGLSTGAVIGIATSVVALGGGAFSLWFFVFKKKRIV